MAQNLTGTIASNGVGYVQATLDGVKFKKIIDNKNTTKDSAPWGMSANNSVWTPSGTTTSWRSVVNSVDIDWNSADLANATAITTLPTALKTTGELLSVIKGLADRITALENSVVTLSNGLIASIS